MKTINEQIAEVMRAKSSRVAKSQDLIKLGIRPHEIATLFKLYNATPEKAISHTIGVEIECFGVDKSLFTDLAMRNGLDVRYEKYNHDTRKYYKIVTDGSIDGDNAIECVSPVLKGKSALKSLSKVLDCLNAAGAKVNRSTGLHVHIGLNGIEAKQYTNIFVNYYFLESAIDKFMAPSRRASANSYCRSLNNVELTYLASCVDPDDIERAFFKQSLFQIKSNIV